MNPVDTITISTFSEPRYEQAIFMGTESDIKQNGINFSMIGLPAYNIKDYDLQVEELQRLQGNATLPPGKCNP